MKKKCTFKKIEFGIQLILLICYLLANLFYYRTFHYISFFAVLIICIKNGYHLVNSKKIMIPKDLRKKWKIMYPLYVILLMFIIAGILWKISFYELNIMTYIALIINLTFPLVVAVCLLIGEIMQRKSERKESLQKQYIHLYAVIFQWCILMILILSAIKTDKYYATTRPVHYQYVVEKHCISESQRGIFPNNIPEDAENIEFYCSPEALVDFEYEYKIHLKMKVDEKYLNQLVELYENPENRLIKQDCSVLTPYNYSEYLSYRGFEKHIDEYFGRNCTLYFSSSEHNYLLTNYFV